MFEIKEIIEAGLNDGIDKMKLLNLIAESIDDEDTKIETFEKLYEEVYKSKLCDMFCMKMVDSMYNSTEKGRKWTIDQTNDIARKLGISFDDTYTKYEFWCACHMMYYDYAEVLQESGITDTLIYGKFADDYLDSDKGKLKALFFFVKNQNDK